MAPLKLKKIISIVDGLAPFSLAESWDHSGLRLGDQEDEIRAVAIALDPSPEAVKKAASLGCNLLLTHHPLMFMPQENMVCDRLDTKAVAVAFSLSLNVLSCHTNFDNARCGVNDTLANLAGLCDVEPLVPSQDPRGFGMGAVGNVKNCKCEDFASSVAAAWNLSGYRLIGIQKEIREAVFPAVINRVALCGGAGGSLWKDAREKGAELYITADLRYNDCLDAVDAGLSLMIVDHGEMENPPLKNFAKTLAVQLEIPVHFIDLVTPSRLSGGWYATENVSG